MTAQLLPFPAPSAPASALLARLADAVADPAPATVAVRTPSPPAPPAPRAPLVVLHLTPLAPRIPAGTPRHDPCRWATFHGAPVLAAVARILERIERKPYGVQVRANADGEIAFYDADPDRPIALVCEGLTLPAIQDALRTLARAAFTGAGHA